MPFLVEKVIVWREGCIKFMCFIFCYSWRSKLLVYTIFLHRSLLIRMIQGYFMKVTMKKDKHIFLLVVFQDIFLKYVRQRRSFQILYVFVDFLNWLQTTDTIHLLHVNSNTLNSQIESIELKISLCFNKDNSFYTWSWVIILLLCLDVYQ